MFEGVNLRVKIVEEFNVFVALAMTSDEHRHRFLLIFAFQMVYMKVYRSLSTISQYSH
jgi:hypothetical protein